MSEILKCHSGTLTLKWRNEQIDYISVKKQTIYSQKINLSLVYSASKAISLENCLMFAIPSFYSLQNIIPSLTVLIIHNCKLSKITADDLNGYKHLKDLYVEECDIEILRWDLFKNTPNLEIVSFDSNKIRHIDEDIFLYLHNIKVFSLHNNPNINVVYNILSKDNTNEDEKVKEYRQVTMKQLKSEISTKCNYYNSYCEQSKKENKLSSELGTLKKQVAALMERCEMQDEKISFLEDNQATCLKRLSYLRRKNEDAEQKLQSMKEQFQMLKNITSDLTIEVELKKFNVHKAIFIQHSQVLAQHIAENPKAANIKLKDISNDSFNDILNYIYEHIFPDKNDESRIIELFKSSYILRMKNLIPIMTDYVKDVLNPGNSFEVLIFCNDFNIEKEPKMKAFDEFKKNFPENLLPFEIASNPEILTKLIFEKLNYGKFAS